MKKKLSVQLIAGATSSCTEQDAISRQKSEIFYSIVPDSLNKPMRLQNLVNVLNDINPFHKSLKYTVNPFPVMEIATGPSKYPVKKINGDEVALSPFLNKYLAQAAVRLSDIELAIYNNDVPRLQFGTLVLKNLFLDMSLPSACCLTAHMEELVNENKLREANDVLLAIKKIIAQIVQYIQQLKNY